MTDRQTDRQTSFDGKDYASIVSRGRKKTTFIGMRSDTENRQIGEQTEYKQTAMLDILLEIHLRCR